MTGVGSRPPVWPRAAVVGLLVALAVAVGAQEFLWPAGTARVAPAALGLVTLALGALVLGHSRRLDALSATTWLGFGGVALLLAARQALPAGTPAGVKPPPWGPSRLAPPGTR